MVLGVSMFLYLSKALLKGAVTCAVSSDRYMYSGSTFDILGDFKSFGVDVGERTRETC